MEECRLRVFANRVLRRIFGPKRDEVTGEWRELHNEDVLLTKFFSGDQIKKNEMGRAGSTYGGEEGYIQCCKSRRIRWAGHIACIGGEKRYILGCGGKMSGKKTTWKTQA